MWFLLRKIFCGLSTPTSGSLVFLSSHDKVSAQGVLPLFLILVHLIFFICLPCWPLVPLLVYSSVFYDYLLFLAIDHFLYPFLYVGKAQ